MKNKNIIISLLFALIILSSCSFKKDENLTNTNVDKVTVKWVRWDIPVINNSKLNFDKKNEQLKIGNDVTINPWIPENFPKDLKIFNNSKTYINSNVPNYTFFVLDKNTELKDISKYYIDTLVSLWYENKIKDSKKMDLNNLEFWIKNNNFIPIDKRNPENLDKIFKSWKIKNFSEIEKEYKSNINIKIHNETPENLAKWMNLNGKFVEIFY